MYDQKVQSYAFVVEASASESMRLNGPADWVVSVRPTPHIIAHSGQDQSYREVVLKQTLYRDRNYSCQAELAAQYAS